MKSKNSQYLFELYDQEGAVNDLLNSWEENNFSARLWHKDWSLWADTFQPEIVDRLGWLELPARMQKRISEIKRFAQEVIKEKFTDLILIGMGGSSLTPEVFQSVFKNASGFPKLTVCDSTHPVAVEKVRKSLDLNSTLFMVSSKSGTTLETVSLFHYFWSEVSRREKNPGNHFIAVTDLKTSLMKEAQEKKFRKIFNPFPDVGGRFSAFTEFGLVPASLIGVDIQNLLECGQKEPDLLLGATLGVVGETRDKLTFMTSKSLKSFPHWLEQLVAESLGKEGKGIIPVINEPLEERSKQESDRFYIFIYLDKEYREVKNFIQKIKEKKVPHIESKLKNKYEIGKEIFNWELAVAAAGSYFRVHPFNQPDVQAAKDFTKAAMKDIAQEKVEKKEEVNAFSIKEPEKLEKAFHEWLSQAKNGDCAAVQAYLAPSQKVSQKIQEIRASLQKKAGIATTMGYGPRYLHSTGQLHKGGLDKGLFLQIVDIPEKDIKVPGQDYSFGSIIKAQSWGDFQALQQRNRRVLRVDLEDQSLKGLSRLIDIVDS